MSVFLDLFDPKSLASSIWGEVDLPDARLLPRLRATTAMLIERLDAPAARVPRKLLVGAQRLWNNARVTPESLTAPMLAHQAGLLAGAASLIVAHDTMEIDLTGRYQTDDVGPLRSVHACGHLLHWALAVDPLTRRPLAALACHVWTRPMTTRKGDHASRPPEARESFKWRREVEASVEALVGARLRARYPDDESTPRPDAKVRAAVRAEVRGMLTHVFDREGDTHDNFTFGVADGHRVITRAAQDHALAEAPGTLWKLLAAEGAWTHEVLVAREVPTKASDAALREARTRGRTELQAVRTTLKGMGAHRTAKLRVRWAPVTLTPDAHVKKSKRRAPVKVWVVHVLEQDVPPFVAPLEWILLTTVPVATAADALWVVDSYRARWPIEPMHAVLKTGLHVEAQRVTDVAATKRLLAVLLPVSLHLMRWAYGWRENPKELARTQVPEGVIAALKSACRYHELPLPRREWTLKDVVLRLAALGGYERRPDRTPGWLVLWRGWRELLRFWRVVHFAQNAAPDELPDKPPPNPAWKPRGS